MVYDRKCSELNIRKKNNKAEKEIPFRTPAEVEIVKV